MPDGGHLAQLPTRGACAPRRGKEDAAEEPFTQENCQHAPLIRRHVRQSGRCFDHHGHLPLVRASPKEGGEEKAPAVRLGAAGAETLSRDLRGRLCDRDAQHGGWRSIRRSTSSGRPTLLAARSTARTRIGLSAAAREEIAKPRDYVDVIFADERLDLARAPARVLIKSVEPVIERLGFDPLRNGTLRLALVVGLVVLHPLLEQLSAVAIPDR